MTREEAINIVQGARKYLTAGNPILDIKKIDEAMSMAIEALQDRPQGEWIDDETNYTCSECYRGCWVNSDYCPWCGADMRGEEA